MIVTDNITIVGWTKFTSKAGKDLCRIYYTAPNDRGEGDISGAFLSGVKDLDGLSVGSVVEAAFGYDSTRNWGVLGIIH